MQYFAKGLLDVVDNLRTMSFIGNDNFSNIDASKGLDKAVQLLQKLHECIVDAEKQIAEVDYFEFVFNCVMHYHIGLAVPCILQCNIMDPLAVSVLHVIYKYDIVFIDICYIDVVFIAVVTFVTCKETDVNECCDIS